MKRAVVVRGRLSDPWHIELAEPVTELEGDVDVVLQPPGPVENAEFGPAESLLELAARIRASIPEEQWKKVPTDGARNLHHYLYGTRKVEGSE